MIKLLLVDDEPTILRGIRESIEWAQYGVEIVGGALNGREALGIMEQCQTDIALVDVVMPHLDGLEFCEQARRRFPSVRLVIVSGHENFSYAQRAIRLGVDDYLLKPVAAEQLVAVVGKLSEEVLLSRQHDIKDSLLQAAPASPVPQSDRSPMIAREVVRYIESTYLSEPRLAEAAEAAGVTPNHLCRVLKRSLGTSFVALVHSYRVEIAKVLLHESTLKIYEVADRAGFTDYRYFTRVFRRLTGCTPLEFRNGPV